MADTKISSFPNGGPALSTDETVIARDNANYTLTIDEISDYVSANVAAGSDAQLQYNADGALGASARYVIGDHNASFTDGLKVLDPLIPSGEGETHGFLSNQIALVQQQTGANEWDKRIGYILPGSVYGEISSQAATGVDYKYTAVTYQGLQFADRKEDLDKTVTVTVRAPNAADLDPNSSISYVLTLPTSEGTAGQVLTTDGSGNLSWSTGGGGGTPAGSTGEIQFNDGGSFGAATQAKIGVTAVDNLYLEIGTSSGSDYAASGVYRSGTEAGVYSQANLSGSFYNYFLLYSNNSEFGTTFNLYGQDNTTGVFGNVNIKLSASPSSYGYNLYLPTSTGSPGQALITDGLGNLSWANATATPAGSTGEIQFNDNGAFGASANITASDSGGYQTITLGNAASSDKIQVYSGEYKGIYATKDNTGVSGYLSYWDFFVGNSFGPELVLSGADPANSISGTISIKLPEITNSADNFSYALTFPTSAGSSGQALTTDGSGTLSWSYPAKSGAPASASATGTAGEVRYDSGFLYVCVATDTWIRAPFSTW